MLMRMSLAALLACLAAACVATAHANAVELASFDVAWARKLCGQADRPCDSHPGVGAGYGLDPPGKRCLDSPVSCVGGGQYRAVPVQFQVLVSVFQFSPLAPRRAGLLQAPGNSERGAENVQRP